MTNSIRFLSVCALSCLLFVSAASGQALDTMRTYIFGHSLINHEVFGNPNPGQETSVPHWFHFLAAEAGYGYAVSGQYGFLNGHATSLPPFAQWGYDFVAPAWDSDHEPFSQADFNNILITPANFIQYQAPTLNYFGDTLTPISATGMIFDWVNLQEDSLDLYIYENWPDMGGFLSNGFPPTASEWAQYDTYLNAGFHDWFIEYHDSMRQAYPNQCVSMIPVGPVISALLSQFPYNQIPVTTLYEDDAPHGRATIYFLAAMVTYMAMYEERAPMTYQVPAPVDSIIINNYPSVVNFIWNELLAFNDGQGNSRVFCSNNPLLDITEEEGGRMTDPGNRQELEIAVYPNPTPGSLQVRTGHDNCQIDLLDLTGRKINVPIDNNQSLNLGNLPEGIYLVRIRDNSNGKVYLRKVLKTQ